MEVSVNGHLRHNEIAKGLPLSAEERPCSGRHAMTGFDPLRKWSTCGAQSRRDYP
jgi:hypothetical protein